MHHDNLLTCDGVLVYYGAAPGARVDIKLRELLKATGYGREAPIGVQAVYVAPPDRRGRSDEARALVTAAAAAAGRKCGGWRGTRGRCRRCR